MKKYMDKYQKIGAIILSSISLLAIGARIIRPSLKIDEITVFFVSIGVLPWLIMFFKKIKISGFEAESQTGEQGTTNNPPPPLIVPEPIPQGPEPLTNDAIKVLATLWRYQRQSFDDDISRRWTFLIYPGSQEYIAYLKGVAQLLEHQLISVRQDNNQVLLTNEGIEYVRRKQEIQNFENIYRF